MGNEMPDIRNVMPVAPDHVPDDLLAPETVDIDLSE
jgi:hypothetical protein